MKISSSKPHEETLRIDFFFVIQRAGIVDDLSEESFMSQATP